jgi:outer membrane protein assembly factor BamB
MEAKMGRAKVGPGSDNFRRIRNIGMAAAVLVGVMAGVAAVSTPSGAAPGTTSSSADWPSFLDGPTHSSYAASATSITPSDIGNLQPVWRWTTPASTNSGENYLLASPTVVGGVIYIGAMDGEFYAISQATHQVLWSDFLGTVTIPAACGPNVRGILATAALAIDPATSQLTAYVNAPNGYVYALNAATGAVEWSGLLDPTDYPIGYYYSYSSPMVNNGVVYDGISSCGDSEVQGGVVAYSQSTGATLASWNSQPGTEVGGSVWSSPVLLSNGSIVVGTGNGDIGTDQPLYDQSVVELNPNTLAVESYWQIPASQQIRDGDFGGSPTVWTATINGTSTPMVGECDKNGYYYAFSQSDINAGPVWQYRMTEPYIDGATECDAAAIWNGTDLIEGGGNTTVINGTTYSGSVQALNPATGAVIWQTGLDGSIVGSPTEDGGGVVTAQTYETSNGQLGVYLLNAATGAVIGFIATPHTPLFGQAVFTGNDLLLGAGNGYGLTDYEITTPGPAITAVSPSTVSAGSKPKLTLTGSGFSGTPSIFISGTPIAAQDIDVVSPTEITFTAPVEAGAETGAHNITVIEPGSPATADTCTACLTVGTPPTPPTITSISPNTVAQGAVKATATLTGTNFESGAKVTSHSGITIKATYVSSTQLDLSLTVSATETQGGYSIFVNNPDGGFASCEYCLTVTAPSSAPLDVTSVAPSSVGQQSTFPKLKIIGTGFASGATAAFSASGITVTSVTYVSSTELTASIHVTSSATLGAGNVTVTSGGDSSTCTGCLTVDPYPNITGVSTTAEAGETVPVTVSGAGFQAGLAVKTTIPGATLGTPTSVTDTSFTVDVTVPAGNPSGDYTLTVTNPDGGIGTFKKLVVVAD